MSNQQAFGYTNPFGAPAQGTARRAPQGQRQQRQWQQPEDYDYQDQQQDPKWDTQAYLKIKFSTAHGDKFLRFGRNDKELREGNGLEAMILAHWRNGGDVNDLLACMSLEVVDANPKFEGDNTFVPRGQQQAPAQNAFTPAPASEEEYEEEPAPTPAPKPRAQRARSPK